MRLGLCLPMVLFSFVAAFAAPPFWKRHTIDASHRGADGVRLADFDGDGLQDVVTGWEESGIVRLYLHPGHDKVHDAWPTLTIGEGASPEDAVPCDVDSDGQVDVISCHEGKLRKVLVHFNESGRLLEATNWKTKEVSPLNGQRWMFGLDMGTIRNRRAIVLGSKGENATITLMLAPETGDRRDFSRWTFQKLRTAGWIMSLRRVDMDGDGDADVLYSDRKGGKRGVGWLEQPDSDDDSQWEDHVIGGKDLEPMFLDGDADRVLLATRNEIWVDFRKWKGGNWVATSHANPPGVPNGKAIARLGDRGLVLTSNTDSTKKKAVAVGVWFSGDRERWFPISTTTSVKLDRIECLDLDGDGDLDVMTCEERKNQGVIWYENPER